MNTSEINSLWGDEFKIPEKVMPQKVIKKARGVKKEKISDAEKAKAYIRKQLIAIDEAVNTTLKAFIDHIMIIRDKEDFINYIDKSIENKIIAIDTETNNSLDPLTCKLMGPCIYTPGLDQAYIPINHVNLDTGKLLDRQLTEEDVREQFQRLIDNDVKILMHNGKFDYQVIKCTCGLELPIYWDTMIGSKILNENDRSAALKSQYSEKIDPSVEKYNIEHLFKGVQYAHVDPDVFGVYSATDAYMTYKLYEYQKNQFDKEENQSLYNVFFNVEMPCIKVVAEMELTGVELDLEYSKRLSAKYNKELSEIDSKIEQELHNYDDTINKWRLSVEANYQPKKYLTLDKKIIKSSDIVPGRIIGKLSYDKLLKKVQKYPHEDGVGLYTLGKSKSEQLSETINLGSPIQLAILIYDILKVEAPDPANPRGTGEDILQKIDLPICKLILEKRGLVKLLNTYIDSLPTMINPKTHRLHCNYNQYGADTGRFSSSDPNLQNIPSHNKEIRVMFQARTDRFKEYELDDNFVELSKYEEINTPNGFKDTKDLVVGDVIIFEDNSTATVTNVCIDETVKINFE